MSESEATLAHLQKRRQLFMSKPRGDSNLRSALARLPKIDLHRHLEGSLSLATLREIALEYELDLPARTSRISELEFTGEVKAVLWRRLDPEQPHMVTCIPVESMAGAVDTAPKLSRAK